MQNPETGNLSNLSTLEQFGSLRSFMMIVGKKPTFKVSVGDADIALNRHPAGDVFSYLPAATQG